ncbi:MAG: metal-dependent transcriptional regulator [Nitrospirota bacterium]
MMGDTEKTSKKVLEEEKRFFVDEALQTIWELREHGEATLEGVVEDVGNEEWVREMESDGLVRIREGKISFTEEGERHARDITRRHRLAERLFRDVLDIKDFEADACRIEHAISPGVEEAICTLLGHPPTCPHGKPIPRGNCCRIYARKVRPLVSSIRDVEVGTRAKVMFINAPAMDRLSSIGLVPGAVIKLQQKRPSFVIDIDETTIAIDEDIANGIFVKPL